MVITIKYFGIAADISKVKEEQFSFDSNSISLYLVQNKVEEKYPEIKNINYSLAVNQSLTKDNLQLNNGDEIVLLPPFAGG